MNEWIQANNLTKKDDSFEVYQNNPMSYSKKKTLIDICIPIH